MKLAWTWKKTNKQKKTKFFSNNENLITECLGFAKRCVP